MRIFDADVAAQGVGFRLDPGRLDDPGIRNALGEFYPEAVSVGASPSVFDADR